jgi:hypothetical protein
VVTWWWEYLAHAREESGERELLERDAGALTGTLPSKQWLSGLDRIEHEEVTSRVLTLEQKVLSQVYLSRPDGQTILLKASQTSPSWEVPK